MRDETIAFWIGCTQGIILPSFSNEMNETVMDRHFSDIKISMSEYSRKYAVYGSHNSCPSLTAHHVGHISPEFYALLVSLRMCAVHKVLNITLQELNIITEKGYQIPIKSPHAMFHF